MDGRTREPSEAMWSSWSTTMSVHREATIPIIRTNKYFEVCTSITGATWQGL
jgi:hypothetical protein